MIAAEPGERFAFRVDRIGLRRPLLRGAIATWSYTLEPVGAWRSRVTETWQDDRKGWPDAWAARFDRLVTRGSTFAQFQAGNIRRVVTGEKVGSVVREPAA